MFLMLILSAFLLLSVNGQRIAGGDPVDIQKYPFAVALLTNGGVGTSYNYGCGGTVITNQAILSAASCFYTDEDVHQVSWWRARVGSTFSNNGGTIYMVSRIIPNPDFSSDTLANDIAVLRTNLAMTLGSVQVARLSGAAYTFELRQRVRAIGWGQFSNEILDVSRELRDVEVFTVEHNICTSRWYNQSFTVTNNMVCTGWLDVGTIGQCEGDAGSPLLDNEGKFVVGVFSRAVGCGEAWFPDVNTRVQSYLPWIVASCYQ